MVLFCVPLKSFQRFLVYAEAVKCCPYFPSNSFMVSGLTLRPFIHLDLSFAQRDKYPISFFLIIQLPHCHLLNSFLSHVCLFDICTKIEMSLAAWVCMCVLYSTPLIPLFVLVSGTCWVSLL